MNVSEKTNEELAKNIEQFAAIKDCNCDVCLMFREAAARLRTFTLLSKAHQRLANDSVDNESNILSKLKVAEDALKWCLEQANEIGAASLGKIEQVALSMSMAGCVKRCERALAAIREEGGAR